MTFPVPLTATRGELLARLATRLGFGAQGASVGVLSGVLGDILYDAQVTLYWTHDWARLRKYTDEEVGVGEYLLDYPDGCNPERVKAISVLRSNVWSHPLHKGIAPQLYTTQDNRAPPARWEPYEQIEFWPKADQVYTVRIFYIQSLDPFTESMHRTTIDSDLVFALALADAKGHYRHPDAPAYQTRAEALLTRLKGKSWGQNIFSPQGYEAEPLAKPVVV
jgi:hypothetical protein